MAWLTETMASHFLSLEVCSEGGKCDGKRGEWGRRGLWGVTCLPGQSPWQGHGTHQSPMDLGSVPAQGGWGQEFARKQRNSTSCVAFSSHGMAWPPGAGNARGAGCTQSTGLDTGLLQYCSSLPPPRVIPPPPPRGRISQIPLRHLTAAPGVFAANLYSWEP